jgi:virginiamycin B lyase
MRLHRLLAPAVLLAAAPGLAAQAVDVREWPVEWEGRPRDPDVAPDGRVWFVGQSGNYIGVFDPASETFRRYDIEPDTRPHNLVVAQDGGVWYAGNGNARIGRLDPVSGETRIIHMPDEAARDPHTLALDGRGNIWFTVQGGGFIGRLRMSDGEVELMRPAGEGTRPYGIAFDSRGHAWVNLFGTHRMVAVDPASFTARDFATPREDARTRRVAVAPDDGVWYSDFASGRIGRIDADDGRVREWESPGGRGSQPYAMVTDDRGLVWYVECARNAARLVAFDPAVERFIHNVPVSSCVRHMVFHPPTRSIWFGTDAHHIGRAVIP